jgi:hypothetical protein
MSIQSILTALQLQTVCVQAGRVQSIATKTTNHMAYTVGMVRGIMSLGKWQQGQPPAFNAFRMRVTNSLLWMIDATRLASCSNF